MIFITKEDIIKLADMSRLTLHDNEIEAIRAQLQDVLTYAQCVQNISCNKTMDFLGIQKSDNIVRPDRPHDCDGKLLVSQSAHHEAHYFVVPAVLQTTKEG